MKILLTIGMALSAFIITHAQSIPASQPMNMSDSMLLQNLLKSMQKHESTFSCTARDTIINGKKKNNTKYVSNKAFEILFKKTSNRILGVSSDVASNGKGATLEFNEALKKISVSHNWQRKNANRINNFGFVAEDASKKLFEIFGKSGWKDGFQFSFGQLIPTANKTIYFLDKNCLKHKKNRERYYSEILSEYQDALNMSESEVRGLKLIKADYDSASVFNLKASETFPFPLSESQNRMLQRRKAIDSLRGNTNIDAYEKLFIDSLDNFDINNAKNLGYHLKWFTWNVSAGLARFSVYDTAVIRVASVKKKSLPRVSALISWNQFQETAKGRILFYTIQGSAGNTNYLEEITPSEISYLKSFDPINQVEVKENYDVIILKDYEKLKKMYAFLSLSATGVWYPKCIFGMGRFLGFEASASAKFKVLEGSDIPARDIFNAHAGFLFTFEKEKIAKTTVAVLARLSNMPFESFIPKKYFNVGIRIGVPFNY